MAHKYAINQYYSIQTDNLLIFSSQVNIKKPSPMIHLRMEKIYNDNNIPCNGP